MNPETKKHSTPSAAIKCSHCGLDVPRARQNDAREEQFCCSGCECVYDLIHGLGMDEFYRLRAELPTDDAAPAETGGISYGFFDDSLFQTRYVQQESQEVSRVSMYLPAMHCAACVWLLERLPEICAGVLEARVNYGKSRVLIRYRPTEVALSKVASTLDSLGYPPQPLSEASSAAQRRQLRRTEVLRLAVAGLSAGNTMMLAVSLYQGWFTGIAQEYAQFLAYVSMILALPAVTYSAMPFYRAALSGLRARMLHIDLPISLGIIGGFLASVLNTFRGSGHVYFDSISALIFLLLVGRWLQRNSVDKVLERAELLYAIAPRSARLKTAAGVKEVYSGSLKPGDVFLLAPNETSPADARVSKGQSAIDRSVLTGESRAVPCEVGDLVYAGTKNLEKEIELCVEKAEEDSRLGRLLQGLEDSGTKKAPLVETTDRLAGYFVTLVLTLAAGTAFYWYRRAGAGVALENTLALLVVSCPCALGLAAPISFSLALASAGRAGMFIKEALSFELLVKIKKVCFDKTGTLTKGVPQVVEYKIKQSSLSSAEEIFSIVERLEREQSHPFAEAFRGLPRPPQSAKTSSEPEQFEHLGHEVARGVYGQTRRGEIWRLGSTRWMEELSIPFELEILKTLEKYEKSQLSPVVLAKDEQVSAVFGLGDEVRPEAKHVVNSLHASGIEVYLLSGDHQHIVDSVAKAVGIPASSAFGMLEPEDKVEKVEFLTQHYPTMMIGDGVNDAAAIAEASVGVAVRGGAEASLKNADVFFSDPHLESILTIIEGARKTLAVVRRNLILSLVYNICGASFAIAGLMSPLAAALLMPASSLTVVLSSLTLAGNSFKREGR